MKSNKDKQLDIFEEDQVDSNEDIKRKNLRKSSKSIKWTWADELTEVFGGDVESNKCISTINSVSDASDPSDK